MIQVRGLTKQFNNKRQPVLALDTISLGVQASRICGIIGPNGAGKTTLLKILAALIIPTHGSAAVNGHDVVRQPRLVRRSIGLVTGDDRSFYWRLTGRQNLEFFGALCKLSAQHLCGRINELLLILGIETYADCLFQTLSAGIRQRFAVARALLHNPPILIIDELSKSLDPQTSVFMRVFMKSLSSQQGKTILLTTHNLTEAAALCDTLYIMNQGAICAGGTVAELTKNNTPEIEHVYNQYMNNAR
jgi:ABC-2 type transport system ATP-binding protein